MTEPSYTLEGVAVDHKRPVLKLRTSTDRVRKVPVDRRALLRFIADAADVLLELEAK